LKPLLEDRVKRVSAQEKVLAARCTAPTIGAIGRPRSRTKRNLAASHRSAHGAPSIDMDPDRAALVNIPAYMGAFGSSFLGLTGSANQIGEAAKSFKVRLERIQLSHDPNDYVMKHASPIFVMRPSDLHPTPLPAISSPEAIAANLRAAL